MVDEPPSRTETARGRLIAALQEGFATAKGLSHRVGLSETQVLEHLVHVERSLQHRGGELERDPARCLKCGHVFEARERNKTPSRCPDCRSERIASPRFRIS